MITGVLEFRLLIREARSLKDKRSVVKGMKARIRAKLNVSIAEVDLLDHRQQAALAAATVSGSRDRAASVLDKVLKMVDRVPGAERFDTHVEYF